MRERQPDGHAARVRIEERAPLAGEVRQQHQAVRARSHLAGWRSSPIR
jgi:hypothetical protein